MKVIVTGCSGYIGSALVDRLVARGDEVVGIDRVRNAAVARQCRHFVQCDLSAPGSSLDAPEVFDGADAAIHLAAARGDWAISDAEYWRDNRDATAGLLAAPWAREVPHWVCMSSVSVYGPAERALDELAPCRPIGAYGRSKLASEELFKAFLTSSGQKGRTIRPSAVFSPGHPDNTNVYKLIEQLRTAVVPLIGGGLNRKTLTYLPNLLELIDWCLADMARGDRPDVTYNYVEEPVQTVAELVDALRRCGVQPARLMPVPLPVVMALAYPIYGVARMVGVDLKVTPERVRKFVASTWYDASRVRGDGFAPSTTLHDALERTVRWHLCRPDTLS